MLHAMIMAGGGGTRFWPRSRQRKPKQFLTLTGDRTLLQQTVDRIEAAVPPDRTWILTGASYADESVRQLPQLPANRVVGEPIGRDTAPCIGLGAALIQRTDPDATMLVLPADHIIEPMQEFRRAAHVAAQIADEHPESLITFGIVPTFPSTGYGYIERGEEIALRQNTPIYRVQSFREKPALELAEQFVATGRYFWNAGIFCWKARTILEQLRANQPSLAEGVERIAAAWDTPRRDEILECEYPKLTKISIDFAVMEKAPSVLVVQAPFRWDDVGSWLALERLHPQDAEHNTVLAEHVGISTDHCVIAAEPGKFIGTVGVNHLIIIQDGDCILVADRRDEGSIKQLVETMRKRGLEAHL